MARYRGRHREPEQHRSDDRPHRLAGAVAGAPLLVAAPAAHAASGQRMGPARAVRERRQLGHQHRQRLPRWPAVLPEHVDGVRRRASSPRSPTRPAVSSRSSWPSGCWPRRAGTPGRPARARSGVRGEPPRAASATAPRRLRGRPGRAPASAASDQRRLRRPARRHARRIAAANSVPGGWKALVEKNPGSPTAPTGSSRASASPSDRAPGAQHSHLQDRSGLEGGFADVPRRGASCSGVSTSSGTATSPHSTSSQAGMARQVAAGAGVAAWRSRGHPGPVRPSEQHRDGPGGRRRRRGPARPGRRGRPAAATAAAVTPGRSTRCTSTASGAGRSRSSAASPARSGRAHALGPVRRPRRPDVPAGSSGADLVGGRAQHHQQRRAAAVGEHPHARAGPAARRRARRAPSARPSAARRRRRAAARRRAAIC